MKFDLFDAMAHLKKNFGNDGELLLRQSEFGIIIRIGVFAKGKVHNVEFVVDKEEMRCDTSVEILNIRFHDAIAAFLVLKEKI